MIQSVEQKICAHKHTSSSNSNINSPTVLANDMCQLHYWTKGNIMEANQTVFWRCVCDDVSERD